MFVREIANDTIFVRMQQAFEYIRSELKTIYSGNELENIAKIVISEITGFSSTQIILNKNTKISDKQHTILKNFVEELKNHKPVQYVIGETEFYGLRIKVNSNVLIPRPETEELVEWIEKTVDPKTNFNILDIGTGSGCIAITLKSLFQNHNIAALDVSEAALDIAKQNAALNNCDVEFLHQDIFSFTDTHRKWNIIVSNPPYIPESEKKEIKPNVLEFEPTKALFVPDNDPLVFYKTIVLFATQHLCEGGMLFFEIHRNFGTQIVELLKQYAFTNVILRKDMFGNDRMIMAILP